MTDFTREAIERLKDSLKQTEGTVFDVTDIDTATKRPLPISNFVMCMTSGATSGSYPAQLNFFVNNAWNTSGGSVYLQDCNGKSLSSGVRYDSRLVGLLSGGFSGTMPIYMASVGVTGISGYCQSGSVIITLT